MISEIIKDQSLPFARLFMQHIGVNRQSKMKDMGVKPELEIFDLGMIVTCLRLRDEGKLAQPFHFQCFGDNSLTGSRLVVMI
jgi:uncharacterized protein (DUF849 family)